MRQLIVSFLLALLAAFAFGVDGKAGSYQISVTTNPSVVPVGKADVLVRVLDGSGKPVGGATVKVFAQMPGMPMGERDTDAAPVPRSLGVYSAPATFGMAGAYDVRVSVNGQATVLTLSTGDDTSASGSSLPVVLGLLAVAIIVILLARSKFRPQRQHVGRAAIAIVLTLIVLAIGAWAVRNLRRPGAMTPLEAQSMEMNSAAPVSAVPVTMATVRRGKLETTVRYTGQIAGLAEQDVFARVTGALVYMPLYVGDRVRKGQIIARLDTSQLGPEVAAKRAGALSAKEAVRTARADYQSAAAMVDQAGAEHEQYMTAIEEAEANLTAAKANQTAMAAQTSAAQKDVVGAQARQDSAQADVDYWQQELGRMDTLFKKGAISRDENQQTLLQKKKADASLTEAVQAVGSAEAKVSAAKAAVEQAAAGVVAVDHKLAEARNEMLVHRAHVADAEAQRASARQKIAQAAAGAGQAEAELQGAAADESYATISSPIDGVVVQRNAAPGTLVQMGTSILKLAQTDSVRLQAIVPAEALESIRVGASVSARTALTSTGTIKAHIASVSGTVDPATKLGSVEAIVPNPDGRFRPGQYDSLEITTSSEKDALLVPTSAIQSRPSGTSVWAVRDGIAHQVIVMVGGSNGNLTSIQGGLQVGDQVVTDGAANLTDGCQVTVEATASAPFVRVGEAGFTPETVSFPAGTRAQITFVRDSAKSCGTEVVFPELGITKSLPLNQPVTVDLGVLGAGNRYSFTCGLGMFKGQVVVN